jgi:hypothetical protein
MATDVSEQIEQTSRDINRPQIQIIEASCRYLLSLKQAQIEDIVMRLGRPNGK